MGLFDIFKQQEKGKVKADKLAEIVGWLDEHKGNLPEDKIESISILCYELGAEKVGKKPSSTEDFIDNLITDNLIAQGFLNLKTKFRLISLENKWTMLAYGDKWSKLDKTNKTMVVEKIVQETIDFMTENIK